MAYYTSLVALWGDGFKKKNLHLYCWKNCKINKKKKTLNEPSGKPFLALICFSRQKQ